MRRSILCVLLGMMVSGASMAKDGPLLDMVVVGAHEGPLQEYAHRRDTYVAGQVGARYTLQLRNNTPRRLLAVVSVDGINVINGQTASVRQGGYVLEPYGFVEIEGWRKSMHDVARFYFTNPGQSYAGKTGRAGQVGVLGVAVFEEAYIPRPSPQVILKEERENRRYSMPSADQSHAPTSAQKSARAGSAMEGIAAPPAPAPSLGTGHGERAQSWASRTTFVRASYDPAQVTEIRYNTYHNLVEQGVIPRWRHYTPSRPSAFPNSFVPDP